MHSWRKQSKPFKCYGFVYFYDHHVERSYDSMIVTSQRMRTMKILSSPDLLPFQHTSYCARYSNSWSRSCFR